MVQKAEPDDMKPEELGRWKVERLEELVQLVQKIDTSKTKALNYRDELKSEIEQ